VTARRLSQVARCISELSVPGQPQTRGVIRPQEPAGVPRHDPRTAGCPPSAPATWVTAGASRPGTPPPLRRRAPPRRTRSPTARTVPAPARPPAADRTGSDRRAERAEDGHTLDQRRSSSSPSTARRWRKSSSCIHASSSASLGPSPSSVQRVFLEAPRERVAREELVAHAARDPARALDRRVDAIGVGRGQRFGGPRGAVRGLLALAELSEQPWLHWPPGARRGGRAHVDPTARCPMAPVSWPRELPAPRSWTRGPARLRRSSTSSSGTLTSALCCRRSGTVRGSSRLSEKPSTAPLSMSSSRQRPSTWPASSPRTSP
jgi:hypothetical protein